MPRKVPVSGSATNNTSRVVAIRLSHDSHKVLSKKASELGVDLGTYLREHLEDYAARTSKKTLKRA